MLNPITYWKDWWHELSAIEKIAVFVISILIIGACFSPAFAADDSSNNQAVWIALIGAVSISLISPFMSGFIADRNKQRDREEDRKDRETVAKALMDRQNALETKTAEAARLLVASNKEVAGVAAKVAEVTVGKLDVIHILVNSTLTETMQELLNITRSLYDEKKKRGGKSAELKLLEKKISELEIKLADRAEQAKTVVKQLDIQKKDEKKKL